MLTVKQIERKIKAMNKAHAKFMAAPAGSKQELTWVDKKNAIWFEIRDTIPPADPGERERLLSLIDAFDYDRTYVEETWQEALNEDS